MRIRLSDSFSNPLLARLTRGRRWPSLRVALWLGLVLGVLSLALGTWAVLNAPRTGLWLAFVTTVAWGVTFISPLVSAAVAVRLTARDARAREVEPLPASISNRALVWGYVAATLHRLRFLLALIVGLMPVLATGTFYTALWVLGTTYATPSSVCSSPDRPCTILFPDWQAQVLWAGLSAPMSVVSLWGANLLGAASGVGLALWWRRTVPAILVALLATVLLMLLLLGGAALVDTANSPAALVGSSLLMVLGPYALGLGVMRFAQRWS